MKPGEDRPGAMYDGWSKTGLLISGIPEINKYTLQAKFDKNIGGSGAQYYTVQFGIPLPPPNGVFDAIAEIAWNTDGTDVRRVVSVGNGISVSGTAQGVRVTVTERTNPALFPVGATGKPYRVDTLITPGTRPSEQMPARLLPASSVNNLQGFFTLAPGAVVITPIPQNSGVIAIKTNVNNLIGSAPPVAGDVDFTFLGTGGIVGSIDPFVTEDWVPVSPTAVILQMTNTTLAKTLQANIIFGIEG